LDKTFAQIMPGYCSSFGRKWKLDILLSLEPYNPWEQELELQHSPWPALVQVGLVQQSPWPAWVQVQELLAWPALVQEGKDNY
jgi:hypothetical protein